LIAAGFLGTKKTDEVIEFKDGNRGNKKPSNLTYRKKEIPLGEVEVSK